MPRARTQSSSSDESDHEQSKVSISKRRKTETAFVPTFKQDISSSNEEDDDDDDDDDDESDSGVEEGSQNGDDTLTTNGKDDDGLIHESRKLKKPLIKTLTKEELEAVNAAKARTGVLYLSKVPPFMKPQKVKHLLSAYGETNRIFLAPENPKMYAKRVRFGGNKRRMFTEGWIEFIDKKKAKLVAETLNASKIGGKKGSFYHDDLWNLKYLHQFKWDDLTAQIAAENASRQARLAAEIEQGKKEAGHYLKNAERNKMIQHIQATRASKAASQPVVPGTFAVQARGKQQEEEKVRRRFNQRDVKDKTKPIHHAPQDDEKLGRVMDSIFG